MNEPLFENVKPQDPEEGRRLFRYIYFRRPGLWILIGVCVILEIAGLWLWITTRELSFASIFGILYLPIVIFILIRQYEKALKVQEARIEEVSSGAQENRPNIYRFYEDHFSYETKTASYNVSYSKLKKTLLHDNSVILVTDSKLHFALDRDYFTIGDAQGLLRFLASKGIK